MLPWPPPWDAGEEQAPEEQGRSPRGGPGKAWNSEKEALGEPGTSPQDRLESLSPRPSWTGRHWLPGPPSSGLVAEPSPGTPVLSPQIPWEVAPPRMTPLAPWDPNYEVKAGRQLVWGPSCASGASFSGRTLCHPSFWPLYEAASGMSQRPLTSTTGHQNGFPVMCSEDIFLSDPLLPRGQRVPLYLSVAPQQVMGSLKLLLPPPIMSPWVHPTQSPGSSTTWLSGAELIALTGLLQMSQGEPRPSSTGPLAASIPPADPPHPASDHPSPSGGQSCSHHTDPSRS